MADKRESGEPKKKKQFKQPEANINSSLENKPKAAPQKQKSQSWFSKLFRPPVKNQELVVTNQQKPAQKQDVTPGTMKDLTAGVVAAEAVKSATKMMVGGKEKQEKVTAKESLTAQKSVGKTQSESLAKGKTAPTAAQELQTGIKQEAQQKMQVDKAGKMTAKAGEGKLNAKQQLTAKESVTRKAGLQKGATASQSQELAASKTKLSAAQKLTPKEKLADGNGLKPPVKKRVSLQNADGRKTKVVKLNEQVTNRVNLDKPKPKQDFPKPEVVVGTNKQGEVNVVNINAFSVPQPTSQAVSRGFKTGQTQHRTARVISASKKKLNNRNENKEQNLSFQIRR